jgi:hypothetical protein
MVRRMLVAASIVVVGLASAAGTGVAETAAKKTPLTKAEFIAQANALCESAAASAQPLVQQFRSVKPSPQAAAQVVAAVAPIIQAQINATKKLVPPKPDQAKIKKMLAAAQAELKKLKADPSLLLKQGGSPFKAADRIARAYGLEDSPGQGVCTKGTGNGSGSGGGGGGGAPPSSPAGTPAS